MLPASRRLRPLSVSGSCRQVQFVKGPFPSFGRQFFIFAGCFRFGRELMTRQVHEEDSYDDDWDEDDPEIGFSSDDDDEESVMPCPYCGWQIPEDTPRCPYCEKYLSDEDAPPSRAPVWIVAGAVACLYVIYRWVIR
jgi:hypothetical protein